MVKTAVLGASAFLLAGMVPLAVLLSRDRLRRHRSRVLIALEAWMARNASKKMLPSFEVARIKYELAPRIEQEATQPGAPKAPEIIPTRESLASFIVPAAMYSALTAVGFISPLFLAADRVFWDSPNFILSGMHRISFDSPSPELTIYQWNTGAAMTAGFLGAYLFTLQYLIGRVRSYELSPTSFLVASVSLIEGCFIVAIVRHWTFSVAPDPAFVPMAFLLGYFPTFGITWLIEHLRVRNLKRIEPAAYDRRFVLPTDMVDGIDMLIKFRLMEAGVHDVQNLATANPVLLYVETPYGLLTILDWIAQAQLIIVFGARVAANLHSIGIRTIFDIQAMGAETATRYMVLEKAWPDVMASKDHAFATPELFQVMLALLASSVHVRRLQTFWSVMISLVEPLKANPANPLQQEQEAQDFKQAAD